MRSQKSLAILGVTEGFRPARPSDRKRSYNIGKLQTVFDLCSANVLMDEPSIEAISRANWVSHVDNRWKIDKLVFRSPDECTLRSSFHHQHRDFPGKQVGSAFEIIDLGQFARFPLVRQQNVGVLEEQLNLGRPAVLRVIVGVERGREACVFGISKNLDQRGTQALLQKIRRDMEVFSVENI